MLEQEGVGLIKTTFTRAGTRYLPAHTSLVTSIDAGQWSQLWNLMLLFINSPGDYRAWIMKATSLQQYQ